MPKEYREIRVYLKRDNEIEKIWNEIKERYLDYSESSIIQHLIRYYYRMEIKGENDLVQFVRELKEVYEARQKGK